MFANSLAPLVTNVLYAALDGSYVPIFRAFVVVYIVAAFAMLMAPPPVHVSRRRITPEETDPGMD
jgi:hypothetical protein